ncbi:acyltransferase family protein [Aliarcobacter cryaerophilus]|uniref:acyltransferase family protein n=1 Tax=Aliarcobacter cryaerophilus TaxID=28198 RepID=UPI0011DF76F8|nr:acyltransferase family protein [Aliarcobacter cryaerophilus]
MNNFIPIVNHSLKYNPSIDGLRGIAISLVIIFHIWPEYLSFGYVGVDIFFLLSGYLITKIIYTKLEEKKFLLKEFYRNRVRRIFPSLIIVLFTTLLFGYLFMFPIELEQLGRHIKSSSFFYENFRLIGEVGYWDDSAVLKPLLHFWSLAIEEQFYIFFPLILMFLYKIRLNIVITLSILFLIFFIIPLIAEVDKFYHTLSRAWELSLGGLVFIISSKYKKLFEFSNRYKYFIYFLFIVSILFSYNNNFFSTYKTFLVVFCTALLILSLSYDKSKTIFSNRLLVFIGLISFPLYLWHYVIISFTHIFGIKISLEIGIFLILISIFLSYLTYRYVEIYARANDSYIFALFLVLIVLFLGFLGNYVSKKDGLPNRKHLKLNENFEKQFIRTPAQNDLGISLITKVLSYTPKNDYIKSTSDDLSKKYILIIGDSHGHSSYYGFEKYAKEYGYESILLSNSSCPPYLDGEMGKNIEDLNQCKNKIDTIYELINSKLDIQKVIFTTRMGYMYDNGFGVVDESLSWNYHYQGFFTNQSNYSQKQYFFYVVDKTFEYFNNKQIKFYYLMENPELGFSPKNCMIRPFNLFQNKCRLTLESYLNRSREYREFIYELSKKYKNVNILDPKNFYCDDKYCYAIKNGKMLYADDDHHSLDGSIEQANYFRIIVFGGDGVK